MRKFSKGTNVEWKWGSGKAEGKVEDSFTDPIERTIQGKTIKREASADKPAYLIKQADGGKVLKSHSELSRRS